MASRQGIDDFYFNKAATGQPTAPVMEQLQRSSTVSQQRHKIILGIDYGTTSTGVAFVQSLKKSLRDINMVQTWPGPSRPVDNDWKTPSRIAYKHENTKWKLDKDKWGFQVEAGMQSHFWTKLLLDKSASTQAHDDPSLNSVLGQNWQKLPAGKQAKDLAREYLTEVYAHVMQILENRYTAATLKLTPMECWVTMPAIWSDAAQSATREAAKAAGFGSRPGDELYMITEPEAAAIAALKGESEAESLNPVKPGENILICDCGGGTVDITTYSIVSTSPLRFNEILVGTGGKCGSTYIDRNLHALMTKRFGDAFTKLPEKQKCPGSIFMNSFETIKRDFGWGETSRTARIGPLALRDVEDSEWYDTDDNTIFLSQEDLRGLFEPVTEQILKLVESQARQAKQQGHPLNRIILVGGFGDSPFLNKILKSWCVERDIKLMCPEHCQATIARGAALRGLEGRPGSNKCRRNYGVGESRPFREGIDNEDYAWVSEFSNLKLCSGNMHWLLRKNETITETTNCVLPLFFEGDVQHNIRRREFLYASDLDVPSDRSEARDVKIIAEITVDFSDADLSAFPTIMKGGRKIAALQTELKIDYGAKEGVLQYSSWVQGKRTGHATVRYP